MVELSSGLGVGTREKERFMAERRDLCERRLYVSRGGIGGVAGSKKDEDDVDDDECVMMVSRGGARPQPLVRRAQKTPQSPSSLKRFPRHRSRGSSGSRSGLIISRVDSSQLLGHGVSKGI